MTFRELIETVRARWYVAAVVVLVTMAAGWKVDHPPKVFQASTVILLVPPPLPSSPNALAAATPSIAATGLLVDSVLGDATSADRLRKAGVTGDYSLTPRNNGTVQTPKYTVPAEQLSVTGGDPNAALTSVTNLASVFIAELNDLQTRTDVPQSMRITTQLLVSPAVAQVHGSKLRGLAGVALLGMIALVVAPVWFDRYLRRRNRRAQEAPRSKSGKTERVPV